MSANARTEVQIPMIEHNKQAVSGDFIQPGPRDTATSPTWASSFHVTSHVQPQWAPSLSVIGQRNRTTHAYAALEGHPHHNVPLSRSVGDEKLHSRKEPETIERRSGLDCRGFSSLCEKFRPAGGSGANLRRTLCVLHISRCQETVQIHDSQLARSVGVLCPPTNSSSPNAHDLLRAPA